MIISTMSAGKSHHEVGTRVRIKGIDCPHDSDLNGQEGELRNPFRGFPIQDVGIRLDDGTNVSLHIHEFEVIDGGI